MRRIIFGLMLVLLILGIKSSNTYATGGSIVLETNKNEFNKNEEFIVNIKLSGVTTQKGIAVMMTTLEYDKETLTLISLEGQNGWANPIYNENSGKLVIDKNSDITENEILFKITFKVKENISQENSIIKLNQTMFSEGIEDIEMESSSKEIIIKGETVSTNSAEHNTNNSENSNENSADNEINNSDINENINTDIGETINSNNQTSNAIEDANKVKNSITDKNTQKTERSNHILVIVVIVGIIIAMLYIRVRIVKTRRKKHRRKKI